MTRQEKTALKRLRDYEANALRAIRRCFVEPEYHDDSTPGYIASEHRPLWTVLLPWVIGLGLLLAVFCQVRCAHASTIENRPYNMAFKWHLATDSKDINIPYIAIIESSGKARAYNKASGARGLCQIAPIVLKEFNRLNGKRKFTLEDLYDPNVNVWIAFWYANERIPALLGHYKIKDTVEARLLAYNAGILAVVKHRMPKESREYIIKYNRLMKG